MSKKRKLNEIDDEITSLASLKHEWKTRCDEDVALVEELHREEIEHFKHSSATGLQAKLNELLEREEKAKPNNLSMTRQINELKERQTFLL